MNTEDLLLKLGVPKEVILRKRLQKLDSEEVRRRWDLLTRELKIPEDNIRACAELLCYEKNAIKSNWDFLVRDLRISEDKVRAYAYLLQ